MTPTGAVHPAPPLALGIPPARLRLWAVGLALMGLAPVLAAFLYGLHDWPAFWSAGATAGTADLVDPARHLAWQRANGVPEAFFAYPPGSAILFVPLAALPLPVGFIVNGLVMLIATIGAGWVAGPVFRIERSSAALALLAFAPVTASVVLGQNAALGLLLAMVAIAGLNRADPTPTGIAIGLLLYKPTYALPLIGLLVLRRRWAELAIVALIGAGWYLAGVWAAAGDWLWPGPWAAGLGGYLQADFAGNADKAISLPGLAARAGVPELGAIAIGGLVVALSIPHLRRAAIVEAAAGACLIGVAVSPHAWGYDAALAAPFLLAMLTGRVGPGEPGRTWAVAIVYLLGLTWLVSRQTVISGVAIAVIILLGLWLRDAWRRRPPPGPIVARRAPP